MTSTSRPPKRPGGRRPASARPTSSKRLPASVYRRRRIAAVVIFVLVIALIVGAVSVVRSLVRAGVDAQDQAAETPTVNPTTSPVTCDASMLTATLSADPAVIQPGWKTTIAAKVAPARGAQPCLANASPTKLGLRITKDKTTVYDSSACAEDDTKRLLFGAGVSWDTEFTWDGQTHADAAGSCAATGPVEAGIYGLQLVLDGKPVGSVAQLTVTGAASSQ
ncbi:hypothetical protein H8R18_07980 [Nanchangia anserum]|uniref:Uncharacterized protein n=1 Tax=Nanchangia anserum TaxID=2692125 RepID=A0A8I0GBX9_9ACTO|nr:hypothetical protein [Nanchangia anserum]MBD3689461.1 hypothetical protein [Nanchangia anserum]QOX81660.1 hypothetical protein H8R18_07980 [Nanchangia anserum]